jgi:hypothetical protein
MFRQVAQGAWSVSRLRVGGSIYDDAQSAATSDAVTILWRNMRARTRARPVTLSFAVSNRVRTGFGTIKPTNTQRGLASPRRSTIPSTKLFLAQLDEFPPTGKSSWGDSGCPGEFEVVSRTANRRVRGCQRQQPVWATPWPRRKHTPLLRAAPRDCPLQGQRHGALKCATRRQLHRHP